MTRSPGLSTGWKPGVPRELTRKTSEVRSGVTDTTSNADFFHSTPHAVPLTTGHGITRKVPHMGKLSDILNTGNGRNIDELWNTTTAANDFAPLPRGTYICRLNSGKLRQARTGTPEYVLTFKVLDGEQKGRQVWHSLYLTPAALPMTKWHLAKIGVTAPAQLEHPVPKWLRCKVQVVLRRDDDGSERNRVRTFEALGIDVPEVDPFAPEPSVAAPATDSTSAGANELEESEKSMLDAAHFEGEQNDH